VFHKSFYCTFLRVGESQQSLFIWDILLWKYFLFHLKSTCPTHFSLLSNLIFSTFFHSSVLSLSCWIDSSIGHPIMPADRHQWGNSVLVLSIIPYLSKVVPCSYLPLPGNNGVHSSAVFANIKSSVIICCAVLSAFSTLCVSVVVLHLLNTYHCSISYQFVLVLRIPRCILSRT